MTLFELYKIMNNFLVNMTIRKHKFDQMIFIR